MKKLYRSWTRRGVLGAGMLAGCARKPERARVDPALAPLVPADATGLVGLRLDLLKKAPVWGQLAEGLLAGLRERTGMDVADDLYEVVYCVGGKNKLALLRGKFTDGGVANSGLEPDLKIPGGQKLPYKGLVLQGREDAAVVFFNSSVALAGRAGALRDAIDARSAQAMGAKGLIEFVGAVPHEGLIYFVSTQPRLPEGGLGGLKSVPFQFQWLKAWVELGAAAVLRVEAQSYGEDGARKAAESLRGVLSMVGLADGKSPWAALAKRVEVKHEGAKVVARGEVGLEAVVGLVGMVEG